MKAFFNRAALMAVSAFALTCCYAKADPALDKLKATLQRRLGDKVAIEGIAKTPIPGLYEVNLGGELIYSDVNGDYVLLGDLIEIKTGANLTVAHRAELNKIDFGSLPFDRAVKVVKGNGARKIAVFSDPNCSYCRLFEQALKQVNNLTVYTFIYPVLSSDSMTKAKSLWCSPNRAKAWQAWMLDKEMPTAIDSCDTSALDKNLALGNKLSITGTPTIFLSNGIRLSGAITAKVLEQQLAATR